MKRVKLSGIILLLIVLLASILRLYKLGSSPALNADEAAIGYNAYSLIETGKDEHGNPWPIHFQSFGDYKPGLYFYLVLPLVKFFGLNELAVRLPGAILGIATVIVVYLLTRELFKDEALSLVASFFLAISPWHIHFSRGAWEVNVATLFVTVGVWIFLRALNNNKLYIFSFLFFILSLYTYHAARVVVPFLVVGLLIINRKKVFKSGLKSLSIAAVFGLIILTPLLFDLTKGNILSRAAGVGLFADPGPLARVNEQRSEHKDFTNLSAKLVHNKPVNYGLSFLENWGEHFWGEFLFLSGDDIQRNKVPETGQMHIFQILFFATGLIAIAKRSKGWGIILLWLVAAPLAAALTFQSPHALRAQNMVIPLVIISAYGLVKIVSFVKEKSTSRNLLFTIYFLLFTLIAWQFARYQHIYWVHMASEYLFSSQHGAKELARYVSSESSNYENIFITDRYDQPYILILFYTKYPPADFQEGHTLTARDKYGFSTVSGFDNYHFGSIDYDKIRPNNPDSLIVGTDEEIPDEANIIEEIYFPNGEVAFEIVVN